MKRTQIFTAATILALAAATAWSQQSQQRPGQSGQLQLQSPAAARNAEQVPAAAPAKAPASAASPAGLTTEKQKASYGIGLSLGGQMRRALPLDDLDVQAMLRGLTDAINESKPAIDPNELEPIMKEFGAKASAHAQERAKTVGDKNKKEGEAFLAANKTKDGVKTTASGLQYKVVKSGKGPSPAMGDTVSVNYKGTLLNGTVFDTSESHGGPASFQVGQVIPGWNEALQLMKVGDKWQLFIPSELAYGERGSAPDIAPNSLLVFEVELLDAKKGAAPQAQ